MRELLTLMIVCFPFVVFGIMGIVELRDKMMSKLDTTSRNEYQ